MAVWRPSANVSLRTSARSGSDGWPLSRRTDIRRITPVGFFYNAELGTIDIGGHKLKDSRKFSNVRAHPKATLVVDDLASVQPWHVRGVEIRGDVEALVDVDPPMRGMSREIIRIRPVRIRSWGLASD